MDYSELVDAVQAGDMQTANRKCAEAIPILKKYLISNVNASPEDAEDAVQKMFEYVIQKIQNDEIESPSGLLSYMLSGARHSYYKIVRDYDLDQYSEVEKGLVSEPDQVWNLIDEEQETILSICLEKLQGHYKDLMIFLFDYPDANSKEIAEYFEITKNNAWIRKHRAVEKLKECVKKYY